MLETITTRKANAQLLAPMVHHAKLQKNQIRHKIDVASIPPGSDDLPAAQGRSHHHVEEAHATAKDFRLYLLGPFFLRSADGEDLTPRAQKSKAVLAMLAVAPRGARSRVWLRDKLWSDRFEDQASASLRQALLDIRKALGKHANTLLIADKYTVTLDIGRIRIDAFDALAESGAAELNAQPEETTAEHFLEGLDVRDPEFEEWLTLERQVWEQRLSGASMRRDIGPKHEMDDGRRLVTAATPRTQFGSSANGSGQPQPAGRSGVATPPDRNKPDDGNWIVAIGAIAPTGQISGAVAAMERFKALLVSTMSATGDIRVIQRDYLPMLGQSHEKDRERDGECPVEVHLHASGDNDSILVTASVLRTADGTTYWSGSRSVPNRQVLTGEIAHLHPLVNEVSEAVIRYFMTSFRRPGDGSSPRILDAIVSMLRLSRGDLDNAEAILRRISAERPSAQAHAWLAFLTTFRVGQRFDRRNAALIEETQYLARRALDADSNCAVTLTLIGHVHSFLFAEYDLAAGLFERAIKANPAQPLAWDLYAILNCFVGQTEKAAAMARWAQHLGSSSPHRFYYDTTRAISASLQGDHRTAIDAGTAAYRERPDFNSILRYLISSHAHLGEMEQARKLLDRLESVEPEFSIEALKSTGYPILETEGGKLLTEGLIKAGAKLS